MVSLYNGSIVNSFGIVAIYGQQDAPVPVVHMSSLRCGTQSSPLVNSRTAEHGELLHSVAQQMRHVLAVACNPSIQWKAMVLPLGVNPNLQPHLHFASA